jgi:stage IV sporulation protein FB
VEATEHNFTKETVYPPKPVLVENNSNNLTRSLVSLAIYAFLFFLLFDQNIAYIAALLVVLLIHEFGHFFAMKLYNYSNVKMFIIPLMGAMVSGKKQDVSQKQMTVIVLAGPIPGLIIGYALWIMNRSLNNDVLKLLSNTFILLNLFNLLPIYPLDGGRFLETLFLKNNYGIRLVFTTLSLIALSILIIFSQSYLMLIIPVLMGIELSNEIKNKKIRDYLDAEKINYHSDYPELPDRNYWLIRDCLIFSFQRKYNGVQAGVHEYSVAESILMRHVMSVLKVNFSNDLSLTQKILFFTLYLVFLLVIPLWILVTVALNS